MSGDLDQTAGDLELRYRRALRLLPRYYRDQWEEDMVSAFLESSLTGDPGEDEFIIEFGKPSWPELASVAALAVRLYLGGTGAPRRYLAWGQAVRRAVVAVLLLRTVLVLGSLVFLAWTHHLLGWLPAPPGPVASPAATPLVQGPLPAPFATSSLTGSDATIWTTGWSAGWYAADYAYIVAYVALVLGRYRTAKLFAVLAAGQDLVYLLQLWLTGHHPQMGPWAGWILFDLVPVLALAAFHRDAPPVARRPWLLALPAGFILVAVPMLALQVYGHPSWGLPGYPGLGCILVAVACLIQAARARSRRTADSGAWSLALVLLAVLFGVMRIAWLTGQLHDSSLRTQGVVQLAVLAVAVALVARDGARAQRAVSPPPPQVGYPPA
jgi:hypothetical protein